jgi:hypothetical protein
MVSIGTSLLLYESESEGNNMQEVEEWMYHAKVMFQFQKIFSSLDAYQKKQ